MEKFEGITFDMSDNDFSIDELSYKAPQPDQEEIEENNEETNIENNDDTDTTTEDKKNPESVGSEIEETKEEEDTNPNKDKVTSPNNFFSSIASSLMEEGVFPDLDSETISNCKTAEDFRKLIDDQIQAGLDEKNRRVSEALELGVTPSAIQQFEGTLQYLEGVKDEMLTSENDEAANLRKQLIYQDYVNRGFSKDKALKEVEKSFKAGTDIDDAKEALQGNKEFYAGQYQQLIDKAKNEEQEEIKARNASIENMKKSIMEDSIFDLDIDQNIRKKIVDNITKPVHKDKDGKFYTEIQKYEMEHREDFLVKLGVIYTLTDGFKNLNKIVNSKVNKKMKKGLNDLENRLSGSTGTFEGNMKLAGSNADLNTFFSKYDLDV